MTDRKPRKTRSVLSAECYDCGLPYASARFEDLLLADDVWKEISPDENGNGLLCPNCIIGRLNISGLHDPTARFVSGPLAGKSV